MIELAINTETCSVNHKQPSLSVHDYLHAYIVFKEIKRVQRTLTKERKGVQFEGESGIDLIV